MIKKLPKRFFKIVKLVGRGSKNQLFDRLEFTTQLVFPDPNPEEELKRLDQKNAVFSTRISPGSRINKSM